MYGKDDDGNVLKLSIVVNLLDLNREVRRLGYSIENTLYEVEIDNGASYIVVPRQLQIDPCTVVFTYNLLFWLNSVYY